MISDLILIDMPENRSALVPNVRQYTLIGDALGALNHMIQGFKSGASYDLMAVDIKACIGSLDKILGINTQEDVLDRIFSSFCIGK
jgi:tRNA modification GTPase